MDQRPDELNGNSPLHIACIHNDQSTIKQLLLADHGVLTSTNSSGKMPLESISHLSYSDQLEIFDLFEPYHIQMYQSSNYLVSSFVNIFLLGDESVGNSLLAEAIKCHLSSVTECNSYQSLDATHLPLQKACTGYDQFNGSGCTVHDFSGNKEYCCSHMAMLEKLLCSPAIFVIVSKMSDTDLELFEKNLQYWFSFVADAHSGLQVASHVIVIGTHYDEFEQETGHPSIEEVQSMVSKVASVFPNQVYEGFVPVDSLESKDIGKVLDILRVSHDKVVNRHNRMSYDCHALNIYLKMLQDLVVINLNDLLDRIKDLNKPCLNTDAFTLKKRLSTLSDKGLLLLLPNDQPKNCWIILDPSAIFIDLNSALFNQFADSPQKLPVSKTGILSVCALYSLFEDKYDVDFLVRFLMDLEFCYEIDPDTLRLTNMTCISSIQENERFLFFPSLVTVERPSSIASSSDMSIGWCFYSSQSLSDRYLQVLLLTLADKYCLPHRQLPKTMNKKHKCHCKVWKNGLYWVDYDGRIESIVEVAEDNRCTKVIVAGSDDDVDCLRQCSRLIGDVLSLKNRLCSCEIIEYMISPTTSLHDILAEDTSNVLLYNMEKVARAMLLKDDVIDSKNSTEVCITNVLPKAEPYLSVAPVIIQELFLESKADIPLTKKALSHIRHSCGDIMSAYSLDDSVATHLSIRNHFNQYSLFAGKNPLDIAQPTLSNNNILSRSKMMLSNYIEKSDKVDIHKLHQLLCHNNCEHNWDEIAVFLKLHEGQIFSLKKKQESPSMNLYYILNTWQNEMTTEVSWETAIEVMKCIKKVHVANEIIEFRNDYCRSGLSCFIADIKPLLNEASKIAFPAASDSSRPANIWLKDYQYCCCPCHDVVVDGDLFKCSHHIDGDIEDLAGLLGVSDEERKEVERKHEKLSIRVYWLLKSWKQSNHGATKKDLIDVFAVLNYAKAIDSLRMKNCTFRKQDSN